MSIDGFLQFLGLIVAICALISTVSRYHLRLRGALLLLPTAGAFFSVIYLLFFDLTRLACSSKWCVPLILPRDNLTPNNVAFAVVLTWLIYIGFLSKSKWVGKRQLPLLATLVEQLISEKRFPELVDFIQPQMTMVKRCASRRFPFQRLKDRIRWHGNPYIFGSSAARVEGRFARYGETVLNWFLSLLEPVVAQLPRVGRQEDAALRIMRFFYTNERLVEYIALERPMFAVDLMNARVHDYDFGDRAFGLMMAHPESQLRRETLLNQTLDRCFFEIDRQNPLIYLLFADAAVAEKLQVWRPIGDYPLRLLERNIDAYRQVISAAKPRDDQSLHRDPSYVMIRFFDIMVRSAMRDGISSHMWLLYFDILVEKLLRSMDRDHPDYDRTGEFPNFGYYLIYEIFHVYGEWLRAIECCPEHSPAVQIENTDPHRHEVSLIKWVMVSMSRSLRHLIESQTEDRYVSYIVECVMRDYRNLVGLPKGAWLQESLRKHLISGDQYQSDAGYGARLKRCYAQIDGCMKYDTEDFEAALIAAYP